MKEPRPPRARPARVDRAAPVDTAAAGHTTIDGATLAQALRQLLEPLAALAIARGVPFATLDEMLKSAFVEAARAAHPGLPGHRLGSRISTTTGINRREVARLTRLRTEPAPLRASPAARVVTSWLADPAWRTRAGTPRVLPRQGPVPSFEALAQSVTRDVHPRSLLDELCRLGLARLDGERVHLVHDSFVPSGDRDRMLRLLGDNVGDHLLAAVTNVLAPTPPHLEQAIFTDELSHASLDDFRRLMRTQWKTLLDATVPALQGLIDADRAAGRAQDQRVRIGLYTYHEAVPATRERATAAAPTPRRRTATKRTPP